MRLHELYPFPEEYAQRKRVGRGPGSGSGCTSGRGNKGQNSRSGGNRPAWFEGGQMPLARRLPKRGFKNVHRVEYIAINLDHLLAAFPGVEEITLEAIYERGLCKAGAPVKILSRGEISAKVSVEAHRFSAAAADKIVKAGGSAKALEG